MADSTIKITLRLFGAFRAHGETLALEMPVGCSVQMIKDALRKKLPANDAALVADSAIGNDREIIMDDRVFDKDAALAILPPVCGG